jgi:tRNA-splicing ligase RtcB
MTLVSDDRDGSMTVYRIDDEAVPILVWGEEPDEAALAQARNLANLPFAHHHVALMADAHVGYGMPIGGVLAARGEVIPHAVGLDIGCGVCAWRTGIPEASFSAARGEVLADVARSIPTGFSWHDGSQEDRTDLFDEVPDSKPLRRELHKAVRQVGTLGGGNHFIEFQRDDEDVVWAMLHSGSRNLGKQMAEHFDEVAKEESRGRSDVPGQWGLAHLAVSSAAGAEYLAVMDFCLRFARESRRLMAESVRAALERRFPGAPAEAATDVHHNYAAVEKHFGSEVVVHRKGAVRASGRVVIPGSMGTASYVGEGLEDADSFVSCSHGAGRTMSRRRARKAFPVRDVYAEMREKDVVLRAGRKGDVAEEASGAYKDIDRVMDAQADLVRPTHRLEPLAVVKA